MPQVQTARLAEIQSLQPHGQFIVTSALRLMGLLSCDGLLVYKAHILGPRYLKVSIPNFIVLGIPGQ